MSLIRKQQLKNIQKCPHALKQICCRIYEETGITITFGRLLQHRYENDQLQQNLKKILEDFLSLLIKMKIEYVIFSPENIHFCIEENQQLKEYYQKYRQDDTRLWEKVAVRIDRHKISYSNKVTLQRHLLINYHYGKRFYQLLQDEGKRLGIKFKLAVDHSFKQKITFLDIQKVLNVLNQYQKDDIPFEIKRVTLTYNRFHHSDSFKYIQIPINGSNEEIKEYFDQLINDLKTIKNIKYCLPELYSNYSSISKQKDNLYKELVLKKFIKNHSFEIGYRVISSNKKEFVIDQKYCSADLDHFSLDELKELIILANDTHTRLVFDKLNTAGFKICFNDLGKITLKNHHYVIQVLSSLLEPLEIENFPVKTIEIGSKNTEIQEIIKLLDNKNQPLPSIIYLDAREDQNSIQMMMLSLIKITQKRNKNSFFKNWQKLKIKTKNNNRNSLRDIFFQPVKTI